MGLTYEVETYARVPDKKGDRPHLRLVRTQYYMRVRCGEGPPVLLQQGQFYSEGGDVLDPSKFSADLWEHLKHCTPAALEAVGFAHNTLFMTQPVSEAEAIASPSVLPEGTKECAICHEQVPRRSLGAHVVNHQRYQRKTL